MSVWRFLYFDKVRFKPPTPIYAQNTNDIDPGWDGGKIRFMFLHLELKVTRFLIETWFELAENVTTGCLADLLAIDAI